MYVDESSDCGLPSDGSLTRYFCLAGVVVHELRWQKVIHELVKFRYWLKTKYAIYVEDELHAAEMINKPSRLAPSLQRLTKHERLAIIRHFADTLATISDIRLINIVADKASGRFFEKDEVFRQAWYALFQRFENTIRRKNFPGPKNTNGRGLIFADNTDGTKLRRYLRDMRLRNLLKVRQHSGVYSYINEPIRVLVEDPVTRDSRDSSLIQAADCVAFLLKQNVDASAYMQRHGGNTYFNRLDPILCKYACNKDVQGIVRL